MSMAIPAQRSAGELSVPEVEVPAPGDVVIPLRLHGGLSLLSTVATFGTPLDVTVAELAIESFYPADEATAAALRGA
jgi:MmyB-like transcription regulator ligand binding domain